MWKVEYTEEFEKWWFSLTESRQDDLVVSVQLLRNLGPSLPRPYADTVKGSKYSNMRELRTQSEGKPLRTFYAFDPLRHAILLIGGDKTGDKRFYEKMLRKAEKIYTKHLEELKNKGLI